MRKLVFRLIVLAFLVVLPIIGSMLGMFRSRNDFREFWQEWRDTFVRGFL